MFRTETPQWALLLTLGLVALLLVPMAMVAQSNESNFNDTFYVNYYDTGATSTTTLPAIDANMYVVNPGSYTDPLTGNPGDLCAMIYVFNTTQELEECCGCHVTANGLLTFRVSQLTNNPLNRRFSTRGAIKLVSAAENCVPPAVGFPAPAPATRTTDALCDPSGGGLRSSNTFSTGCGPVVPTPELRAWIIHYNSGNFQEAEFEDSPLSGNPVAGPAPRTGPNVFASHPVFYDELSSLQTKCASVLQGSGTGVCSCPAGTF